MRRVARGPVVILTCDPDLVRDFWLYEYAPLVLDTEARRYPAISDITDALGGTASVQPVPIPADCTDGFNRLLARNPCSLGPGGIASVVRGVLAPPERLVSRVVSGSRCIRR